jgi:hypothetical protein
MEPIISYGGLLVVLAGGIFCRNERVFIALATAFSALFAAAITLRYWWILAGLLSPWFPPAELCFGCYWLPFGILYFVILKLKDNVDERDIPVYPRFISFILSPLLMAVPFAVFLCGIMASLQISLPERWEAYKPADMPIRWDRLMINAYQAVEDKVCRIHPSDAGHTRFPKAVIPHGAPTEPLWE